MLLIDSRVQGICSVAAATLLLAGCATHHVPAPKSDVPFDFELPWRNSYENIEIHSLDVTVLDKKLNLFNNKVLVEVVIRGQMRGTPGFRPKLVKAHVYEKALAEGDHPADGNSKAYVAEIGITPLSKAEKSQSYDGGSIPFVLTQQLVLQTMGWGENVFLIRSGKREAEVAVGQFK